MTPMSDEKLESIRTSETVRFRMTDGEIADLADYCHSLLSQLAEQRKEVEELRKQVEGKWISVEERWPELSIPHLVVNKYGWLGRGFPNRPNNSWYNENGHIEEVTHWMPFPEPPKQ